MASAQSLALRSIPGYVDRPSSPADAPVNYPSLPTLDAFKTLPGDASLPNYTGRLLASQALSQLGTQQNNAFSDAIARGKQALAGYGGYYWKQDDPNTAYREDIRPGFDPSKGPGAKEKAAYQAARGRGAAAGITEGTIANQNIASALQRVSLEAQSVVNQYADQINAIATDYNARGTSLVSQYAGLYGADATYALEHPPPPPPDWMAPAGTVGDVWAGYHQPDPEGLASMYPGMNFSYRTDPDGRVVVTASPVPQAPAPAAAPAQNGFQPNRSGNIVTGIKFSDLTPHSASLLALQYPGYKLVRSGSGIAVLKKV